MANFYCNDTVRIHSWVTREKSAGGIWRTPRAPPSQDGAHRARSSPSNENTATHVLLPKEAHQKLSAQDYS